MSTCAPRSKEDLIQMAKAIADLDTSQAAKALSSARNKPPGPFYWVWVQGLISGIVTHTKYIGANELFAQFKHGVETPLAAAVSAIKKVTGLGSDVDRYFFGEGAAALWGHYAAIPKAMKVAYEAIKSGVKMPLDSEVALFDAAVQRNKERVAAGEKAERISLPLQRINAASGFPAMRPTEPLFGFIPLDGLWGRILGIPGDVANGIHTYYKVLGENASIQAQAYAQAIKEGQKPGEDGFFKRRAEIADNPTEAMQKQAVNDAYSNTFMAELGPRGKQLAAALRDNPVGKWLFPFMHIPVNILKEGFKRTPLGLFSENVRDDLIGKNGGRAQDMAVARMITGSTILGYFAYKYLNGEATGDYPTDQKEQREWKLTNKIPNALLIGNTWVSTNKFGPVGSIASLGANWGSAYKAYRSGDDDAYAQGTWKAVIAVGEYIKDEVGFQTLANMFEALRDENKATALTATTAVTVVPFSSLLSQTASISDPYMREAKTFLDGLKYRLPGARQTLLPKRDELGQPITNPQYGNIIRQREATADPVALEMQRLNYFPAPPQDRISGIKLTPELYDRYQTVAGALARQQLEWWQSRPGWNSLPPVIREEAFKASVKTAHSAASSLMQIANPQIISQAYENVVAHINGDKQVKKLKE